MIVLIYIFKENQQLNYHFTESLADRSILFWQQYLREKGSLKFIFNCMEILFTIFQEIESL